MITLTKRIRKCSIDSCSREAKVREWCHRHYIRWQRYGSPFAGRDRYETPEESFAARTKWQEDCLIWTGAKSDGGYGLLSINNRNVRAHRYAWERLFGEIPEGKFIDHKCWNRACVNTEHLRIATRSENNQYLKGQRAHNKSSGVRNVYPHGSGWRVRVSKTYFGTYSTIKEAAEVAEKARLELFGEYAGKG